MDKKQIIEALKKADVDGAIISAVESLDNSAEVERLKSELESEQGKAAAILADKKKYKERAEKAESEIKKVEDSKLPEEERHAKQLKEIQEQLEAERAEREKDKSEYARVQRDAKLTELASSVKWADGTPQSTAKLIISNAMTDIDLSDETKVSDIIKSVKETHKSFIAAEAPGGTGGRGNEGPKGEPGGGASASSIADNQKQLWGDK